MSFPLNIDHEHRQVFATADGRVTLAEVRAHLELERLGDGLGYPELIDARSMVPAFTPAEIREMVHLLRGRGTDGPLGPTAVLVSSDAAFGMMRMLEMLMEGVAAVRPFRDQAEAAAWLCEVSGRRVLPWPVDRFPPPNA
jgi:hypothetical protein